MSSITDVENKARELADMIQSVDVYKRYLEARQAISADVELKKRTDEFRRRNFELQNSEVSNPIEARMNLTREYNDVLKNHLAKEYLDSEIVVCRMMQHINIIVNKDLNIDVNFM
jgi:cell fate (sporulation/competence/biofilm development) regulator YlbF (YheA/YmcA/DUF963 family)